MSEEKKGRSLAVGISYVGLGEPGDGVPASSFKHFPIIHEGSVAFNFSETTPVDFRGEGLKDAWESFDKAGEADSIEFAIPSPTNEEMLFFCGGSISGDEWQAPVEIPNIRKTLKMNTIPYKGRYIQYCFVNCKVSARLTQAPSSENTDLLLVKCTKLAAITSAGQQMSPFTRGIKNVTLTTVTSIKVNGTAKVGERLSAIPEPAMATGAYQWVKKKAGSGGEIPIEHATGNNYVIQDGDLNDTIACKFIANGSYTGTVTSAFTSAVSTRE